MGCARNRRDAEAQCAGHIRSYVFCKELGYAEHQRVSVVHHDTDNVHIHVAINKIHPTTLTLHNPGYDYKTRSKLCAILEHELVLCIIYIQSTLAV
jgi:hypothetical protein